MATHPQRSGGYKHGGCKASECKRCSCRTGGCGRRSYRSACSEHDDYGCHSCTWGCSSIGHRRRYNCTNDSYTRCSCTNGSCRQDNSGNRGCRRSYQLPVPLLHHLQLQNGQPQTLQLRQRQLQMVQQRNW